MQMHRIVRDAITFKVWIGTGGHTLPSLHRRRPWRRFYRCTVSFRPIIMSMDLPVDGCNLVI